MKSKTKEKTERIPEITYPSLVKLDEKGRNFIVLALQPTNERAFEGMVIHSDSTLAEHTIGYISPGWDKASYRPYTGEVSLSND